MPKVGRPPVLDHVKKGQILAILSVGCNRRIAARYVGCSPKTIQNTADREPEFAKQLHHADHGAEIEYLKRIRTAAQKEQYWRAAAWALERLNPEDVDGQPVKVSIKLRGSAGVREEVFDGTITFPDPEVVASTSQGAAVNTACLGAALRAFHSERLAAGQEIPWEDVVAGFTESGTEVRVSPVPDHVAVYRAMKEEYAAREREALG